MSQIVVIGAGSSITEGVERGLWNKLEGSWTLGCNSIFKFIVPTGLVFVDYHQFYEIFYKELQKVPLIFGRDTDTLREKKHPNTILLRDSMVFDKTLQQGVYNGMLCGLFSLSLAIFFLAGKGDIFLLGFDFGAQEKVGDKWKTHFYQADKMDFHHPGLGYMGFYGRVQRKACFNPFKSVPGVNIYNVSMVSALQVFPKITYDEFFERLEGSVHQNHQRNLMVDMIKALPHFYY